MRYELYRVVKVSRSVTRGDAPRRRARRRAVRAVQKKKPKKAVRTVRPSRGARQLLSGLIRLSHVMNALRRIIFSSFAACDRSRAGVTPTAESTPSLRRDARSKPCSRGCHLKKKTKKTKKQKNAPFAAILLLEHPGASSRKSAVMSARAATATGLSLARLYCARSCSRSACITRRAPRARAPRTVFMPTATTSGLARSCTNWFTSCFNRGSSASGGTSSWHAVAHAAELGDVALVRLHVPLQERVQVEQVQSVQTPTRDSRDIKSIAVSAAERPIPSAAGETDARRRLAGRSPASSPRIALRESRRLLFCSLGVWKPPGVSAFPVSSSSCGSRRR